MKYRTNMLYGREGCVKYHNFTPYQTKTQDQKKNVKVMNKLEL